MARQPLRAVRCTLQTPLPRQCPTAQHGGKERAARGLLSWPGSARPYAGAFSIALQMRSQAGREPGAPARSGPHLLGAPGPPLSGSPQDGGSRAPRGSACVQTLPVFMAAAGPGRRGDKSSPSPANKTGIQGRERAAAPGRPGPPAWPAGRGISPPGRALTTWGLLSARWARHAARTQPCGAASPPAHGGEWVARHGRGHLDVPRVVAPKLPARPAHVQLPACPAQHLACPAMCRSLHAPLHAETRVSPPSVLVLRGAAKEPPQRREVTGAMPGALEELRFVSIAANTSRGRWSPGFPTQTLHNLHLPLPSLQLPPFPRPPASAQAAESGPGAGPASSQRHYPHLAGACCAGELGKETSGPAERFPGRAARAPCAVASALGRAPQSAGGCSSFLIPTLEIIYLLKNSFPQEVCSNAEGHLQLQGKNKQFEP